MKLVEVFRTNTEPEARMWEELLKNSGIPAFVDLPATNQFLRAGNGGAAQPFDVWLIKVPEVEVSRAKELLPEPRRLEWQRSRPRNAYIAWIIVSLLIMGVMYAVSYYLMINYISKQ
jgi:hypothetical protein